MGAYEEEERETQFQRHNKLAPELVEQILTASGANGAAALMLVESVIVGVLGFYVADRETCEKIVAAITQNSLRRYDELSPEMRGVVPSLIEKLVRENEK